MEKGTSPAYRPEPGNKASGTASGIARQEEIFEGFRRRQVNLKFGPPVVYLETVAGCPFSCAMCKPAPTKPRKISGDLLKKIEPAFPGLEVLAIHGQGEPLLADLDYFVFQSIQHGFVLHTDTNGFLLTDEIADLLLQTRLSIRFSIHAGRPETYYRIMGVDQDKVIANIKNLVEKSRYSRKEHDFWFSFVVMKENIDEVEDFLHLAHECGIRSVRFMRLWPNNDILKGVRIRGFTFKYAEQSNAELGRNFSRRLPEYSALAERLGIRIEWGDKLDDYYSRWRTLGELANKVSNRLTGRWFFPLIPSQGLCAAPWLGQLNITFNGNVFLCCLSSAVLGNLYDSTVDEIWHGPRMTRIRQAFRRGYYPHECGYCRGFGLSNYPHNSFAGLKR